MKKIFLLIIAFSGIGFAQQQNNQRRNFEGTITGSVFDSLSNKPIEYSNISIFSLRDSSLITGTVSREDGTFEIPKVRGGMLYAQITFMGYEKVNIDSIRITPKEPEIDLGKIYLRPTDLMLDNVTITGQRDFITNTIDKKIIDVDKLIAAQGGNALDVLQNVPSVNVDVEGNVSIRGNSNLKILVDGKESGLASLEPSDLLQSISASSIDRIELITNPSSKYNPEGTAGILNIILKRKASLGFNATVNANAGTGEKYNASTDINLRQEFFNLSGGYDYRNGRMTSSGESIRDNDFGIYNFINQESNSVNNHRMNNGRIALDLVPDESNVFSLGFNYRNMNMTGDNKNLNTYLSTNNDLLRKYSRNSGSDRGVDSYEYSLGYRHNFSKDHQFNLEVEFEDDKISSDQNIYQDEHLTPFTSVYQTISSKNKNKDFDIQGDYTNQFGKNHKVEAGFRSRIRDLSTDNNYLTRDPNGNMVKDFNALDFFEYKEQIHALYVTYGNSLGNLNYQVGLRGEMVTTEPIVSGMSGNFKNEYTSLYPSAYLLYSFSEFDELMLNYSRRVDRPNNRVLNPYVDYSDSLNISAGNPYLKPQYINSIELGYSKYLGKTSINAGTFFRNTMGLISSITILKDNGQTFTTYENLSSSQYYGGELSITHPFFQWFRVNGSITYFVNEITDGLTGIKINSDAYTAKLNASLTLPAEIQFQLLINYSSPTISARSGRGGGGGFGGGGWGGGATSAQTKVDEMYSADIALRKDFLDKKLTLTFRVSDIFNTRNFNSTTTGNGYSLINERQFDSRVAFLGLSYRFTTDENNRDRDRERERNRLREEEEDFEF